MAAVNETKGFIIMMPETGRRYRQTFGLCTSKSILEGAAKR
jgi:hypothetical protein